MVLWIKVPGCLPSSPGFLREALVFAVFFKQKDKGRIHRKKKRGNA